MDYLATNPPGEERAKFKLCTTIPNQEAAPDNPDGSRPTVFIDVEADTCFDALSALTHLHEQKVAPAFPCTKEQHAIASKIRNPETSIV